MNNYQRIEKAIIYILNNFQKQPSLEEIAKHVYMSEFHFQRIFTEWAGVSPKKFLQYISIEHAKRLLTNRLSLEETTFYTGFSSTSRLHDLFVSIEGMTPGEYKNGGKNLFINYNYYETKFGKILLASTQKGICQLLFINTEKEGYEKLISAFPNASLNKFSDQLHEHVINFFNDNLNEKTKIKLHLKASPFQLKIWEALLTVPFGSLVSYSQLADKVKLQKASRAVGNAVANNSVAYLIPCHRVIKANGIIGEYRWGFAKKAMLIGWEGAKLLG